MRNKNRLHVSCTHPLDNRRVATKMAAATNAATRFSLIAKQLEEKVAR